MALYAHAGEMVTCEKGHDIAVFARDVEWGKTFDVADLTAWRQAPPTLGQEGMPTCALCGSPFADGTTFHVEGNWRGRPIAHPKRKEFTTMAEMMQYLPGAAGGLSLKEAQRMDAEIAAAQERPPWWHRLWTWIRRWL